MGSLSDPGPRLRSTRRLARVDVAMGLSNTVSGSSAFRAFMCSNVAVEVS